MSFEPKRRILQFILSFSAVLASFFVLLIFSFYPGIKFAIVLRVASFLLLPFCYIIATLSLTRYIYEFDGEDFTVRRIFLKKEQVVCRVALCEIEKIERKSKYAKNGGKKPYRYAVNLFPNDPLLVFTSYRYSRSVILLECPEEFENIIKEKTSVYRL